MSSISLIVVLNFEIQVSEIAGKVVVTAKLEEKEAAAVLQRSSVAHPPEKTRGEPSKKRRSSNQRGSRIFRGLGKGLLKQMWAGTSPLSLMEALLHF